MNAETPTHVINAALGTLWTLYPSRNWRKALYAGSGTGVEAVLAPTWALIKGVKKALDPNETHWPEAAIISAEKVLIPLAEHYGYGLTRGDLK